MSERFEAQMDRYLRGDLSPAEARELAQTALDQRGLFEDLTLAAVAIHGIGAQPGDETLVSYVTGRLSPAGQRDLAQAALADDQLFDALAAHGAVENSLERPEFRAAVSGVARPDHKIVSFPRRFQVVALGAIAAAIALVAVYLRNPVAPAKRMVDTASSALSAALTASLDPGAGKPILLAQGLATLPGANNSSPVFRSAEPESRAPLPEGSIVAVDNLLATVNLGSLDGLAKGTQLKVFRGASTQLIGRVEINTVFRDRARGLISGGQSTQVNDRVRPAASVYLNAVVERIDSLADRGDIEAARKTGRDALTWAKSNNVVPGETRQVLERVARMDYKSGDLNAAEQDYRLLVDGANSPPAAGTAEQDAAFNAWGALLLLRGDTAQAEAKFRQTHDVQGLNNAGVIAELRGETANAQALYEAALRLLDKSPTASPRDRQSIEANLARLAQSAHEKH